MPWTTIIGSRRPRQETQLTTDLAAADRPSTFEIIERYHRSSPSPQNAVDIFAGDWSSILPESARAVTSGFASLFDDPRINWMVEQLGGVEGARILELGPLEGGHTYSLEVAHGAGEIVAVESNERAYLKCLVAKELLATNRSRFLLGDCDRHMEDLVAGDGSRFDVVVSCGVLYHMEHPARHIELLCRSAEAVFVWTHYYDRDLVEAIGPDLADRFTAHSAVDGMADGGFTHTVHRHEYGEALGWGGFCGGGREFANWMELDDIRAAFDRCRFDIKAEAFHNTGHPHGPAIAMVATARH